MTPELTRQAGLLVAGDGLPQVQVVAGGDPPFWLPSCARELHVRVTNGSQNGQLAGLDAALSD